MDSLLEYLLMSDCHTDILDVAVAPNNGTSGSLHHMLRQPSTIPTATPPLTDYNNCPYPNDDVAKQRRNESDCTCDDWQVGCHVDCNVMIGR